VHLLGASWSFSQGVSNDSREQNQQADLGSEVVVIVALRYYELASLHDPSRINDGQ